MSPRYEGKPRMDRHLAGLAELRVPNGEDAVLEVDVVAVESARFSGA
jgi:hypothetical protein